MNLATLSGMDMVNLLENEEAAGQTDNGWTIVQSKSTTRVVNGQKPVVGADTDSRHQNLMMRQTRN